MLLGNDLPSVISLKAFTGSFQARWSFDICSNDKLKTRWIIFRFSKSVQLRLRMFYITRQISIQGRTSIYLCNVLIHTCQRWAVSIVATNRSNKPSDSCEGAGSVGINKFKIAVLFSTQKHFNMLLAEPFAASVMISLSNVFPMNWRLLQPFQTFCIVIMSFSNEIQHSGALSKIFLR